MTEVENKLYIGLIYFKWLDLGQISPAADIGFSPYYCSSFQNIYSNKSHLSLSLSLSLTHTRGRLESKQHVKLFCIIAIPSRACWFWKAKSQLFPRNPEMYFFLLLLLRCLVDFYLSPLVAVEQNVLCRTDKNTTIIFINLYYVLFYCLSCSQIICFAKSDQTGSMHSQLTAITWSTLKQDVTDMWETIFKEMRFLIKALFWMGAFPTEHCLRVCKWGSFSKREETPGTGRIIHLDDKLETLYEVGRDISKNLKMKRNIWTSCSVFPLRSIFCTWA